MKRKAQFLLPFLVLLLQAPPVAAQGTLFKEWFGQKKTQKEYLMNQIAALKVYIEYAKKGYKIYDKGLNLIGSFKDGEFNLHNDFFLSLRGINPEVAKYSKVAATIQLQYNLSKICSRTIKEVKKLEISLTKKEYLLRVAHRFIEDSENISEELLVLTTTSKLELTDDQRITRIDKLYAEMEEMYIAAKQFKDDIQLVEKAKSSERMDIEIRKVLGH